MPRTSVIMACHGDRQPLLAKTLYTLAHQIGYDFEVVVASDGPPGAEAVVARFRKELAIRHVWSHPDHVWVGAARTRNAAIRVVTGQRRLIIDCDCLCPANLVASHAAFADGLVGVIGFRRHLPAEVHRDLTEQQLLAVETVPSYGDWRGEGGRLNHLLRQARRHDPLIRLSCWTCHLSIPTHIIRQIGGFWAEIKGWGCEDCELGLRALRARVRYHVMQEPTVY